MEILKDLALVTAALLLLVGCILLASHVLAQKRAKVEKSRALYVVLGKTTDWKASSLPGVGTATVEYTKSGKPYTATTGLMRRKDCPMVGSKSLWYIYSVPQKGGGKVYCARKKRPYNGYIAGTQTR